MHNNFVNNNDDDLLEKKMHLKTRHVSDMDPREYAMLSDAYTRVNKCVLCGESYCELHNIGRLCCRVHPGLLSLDQRGQYSYSCCGAISGARGCLRTDHMQHMPASSDETKRHDDLAEFAVTTVPNVLFEHGVTRPLNETVLYQQAGQNQSSDTVRHKLPFATVDRSVDEIVRDLSASVPQSPLLMSLYSSDDSGGKHQALLTDINKYWRETLDEPKKQRAGSEGSHITGTTRYIIPFTVICRIKA